MVFVILVSAISGFYPSQIMPFALPVCVAVGWLASRNVNKIDDWLKERT
jgi:hypothetical protein